MANKKISQFEQELILDGSEVLPIVKDGVNKKISITQIVEEVDSYTKSESDDLFDTKVDKVTGKQLSTNDLTNELLTLLTTNKVKNVTTDAVNDKLVITYTDDTTSELNINDIITDVYVSGASLDATTNVLTLTSSNGGADITVNLSDFANSSEITTALATKVSKVTSTDGAIVAFSGINGDVKDSLFTIADLKTYIGKAGFNFISTDLLKVGTTNVNWDGGVVPTGKVGTAKLSGLVGAVVGTWNKIGDSTTLLTTAKTTIVGAINELFNTKVTKVTSTDNAIVRFDGTTGEVQNSGVFIDDAGNVGIGVTPSAWRSYYRTLDFVNGLSVTSDGPNMATMVSNAYFNASDQWIYKADSTATMYTHNSGVHKWYTAPSGTANNPITWTTAMTLGSNGNLLIGTSTDNGVDKLQVNGSISSLNTPFTSFQTLNYSASVTKNLKAISCGFLTISQQDTANTSKNSTSHYLVSGIIVSGTTRVLTLQQIGTTQVGVSGSCPFTATIVNNSGVVGITITNTHTVQAYLNFDFSGYKSSSYVSLS